MDTYDFSQKWLSRFQNGEAVGDREFPSDCRMLGFTMDCGQSFISAFPHPHAFQDPSALEEVLPRVADAALLGSAIFSKWRWITHWEYHGDLHAPENSRWFSLALTRLLELSAPEEEKNFTPVLLRLVTEPVGDGEVIEKGRLCRQEVLLAGKEIRITDERFEMGESIHCFCAEKGEEAADILWQAVSNGVSCPQQKRKGRWTLWALDGQNRVRRRTGNLGTEPELSETVRLALRCRDIPVLDETAARTRILAVSVQGEDFSFRVDSGGISGTWRSKGREIWFSCEEKDLLQWADASRFFAGCTREESGDLCVTAEYETGEEERASFSRYEIPEKMSLFLNQAENLFRDMGIHVLWEPVPDF